MFVPLPSLILPEVLGTDYGVTSPHTGPSGAEGERGCALLPRSSAGYLGMVLLPLPMTAPFPANCY